MKIPYIKHLVFMYPPESPFFS